MTMTVSGGGGVSLNEVLTFLFGSNYSGASTAAGKGVIYINSVLDPDYTSAGGNDT
jgi:hypothetical protein